MKSKSRLGSARGDFMVPSKIPPLINIYCRPHTALQSGPTVVEKGSIVSKAVILTILHCKIINLNIVWFRPEQSNSDSSAGLSVFKGTGSREFDDLLMTLSLVYMLILSRIIFFYYFIFTFSYLNFNI
jgi:hypothetical protein